MKYILSGIGWLFKNLFKYKVFTSYSFAGVWLIFNFFSDLIKEGFMVAGRNTIYSVGGAEIVVRDNVLLAINNPEAYNFINFIEILASVMILWTMMKIIVWFGISIGGGQAKGGLYILSIPIIALITLASGVMLNNEWFIPFYDSVIFLFRNISPVLTGALPSWLIKNTINQTATNISQNISINSTVS